MILLLATLQYALRIKQNVFLEEDKTKNCRVYPNDEFSTYSQCDQAMVRRYVREEMPGIMPFWLSDHLDNVTTQAVLDKGIISLKKLSI